MQITQTSIRGFLKKNVKENIVHHQCLRWNLVLGIIRDCGNIDTPIESPDYACDLSMNVFVFAEPSFTCSIER